MHRILIVEDDRDIAQLMEAALTQAGYQVELAFDGEVGADLIEQNQYALALLDIMLPKIDGYELFAYLREVVRHSGHLHHRKGGDRRQDPWVPHGGGRLSGETL